MKNKNNLKKAALILSACTTMSIASSSAALSIVLTDAGSGNGRIQITGDFVAGNTVTNGFGGAQELGFDGYVNAGSNFIDYTLAATPGTFSENGSTATIAPVSVLLDFDSIAGGTDPDDFGFAFTGTFTSGQTYTANIDAEFSLGGRVFADTFNEGIYSSTAGSAPNLFAGQTAGHTLNVGNIAAIPEPSTSLLGALAGLAFLTRRNRKS